MTDPSPADQTGHRFLFLPASHVAAERVDWLVNCWIPRRSLTLLAGREGLGKSTIAVDLAAQATRGELGSGEPMKVLYLSTEDSRSMTVRPRLEAAGANLDMVGFLDIVRDGYTGALELPVDYDRLADLIAAEQIGLVILDAAKSAMSSQINDHRDDDVRRFLEPMSAIADALDCVFLALVHFGKRTGSDTGSLILGSIAWSQVARSVLSAARDDEDGSLVVTNTKGNLAPRTLSREARIIGADVPLDDGTTTTVGRVHWGEETTRDARDFLAAHDDDESAADRSAAADWLEDYLRINPNSQSQAVKIEARKVGHSERTLKRAMQSLKVVVTSEGFPRRTIWNLPDVDTLDSQATPHPSVHEAGPTGPTGDELHKHGGPTGGVDTVGPAARTGDPLASQRPNLANATDPGSLAARDRAEFVTDAAAAIDSLRGKDRATAQAHYFRLARDRHDMTTRDIADAFGVSHGTVGNRLHGRSDTREGAA